MSCFHQQSLVHPSGHPSYKLPAQTWVTGSLCDYITWKKSSALLAEELFKRNFKPFNDA